MPQYQASRTAIGAALYRAAHQLLDCPLVFADPLAVRIMDPPVVRALREGRDARTGRLGLRAFIAARSRLAEDRLAAAYRRGVRQYVLLGAGLDTFGYRNELAGLRVFEVDQPATQASKRQRLAAAGIAVPPSVTFAAVDFERETLADGLTRAGLELAAPSQFAMLGVTMYLSADTVRGAASFVAGLPAGSEIVFDYAALESADQTAHAAADSLSARVAAAGEPFTAVFPPGELHLMLTSVGFTMIEDFDAAALNSRYFAGRADGLAVRGRARIAAARN